MKRAERGDRGGFSAPREEQRPTGITRSADRTPPWCRPSAAEALRVQPRSVRRQFQQPPRQNVVFEHGYPIAKLGRRHVCALVKSGVEVPNDISAVVYIQLDEHGAWQLAVAKELLNAGYDMDMNKVVKASVPRVPNHFFQQSHLR